jgi:hypothetical protein
LNENQALERGDWNRLTGESLRVFALNEVDLGDIYYHMPNHDHYPSLFAWDSGFHAAAMSHLDAVKAQRELETLFRQEGENGHLPHETLLPHRASRPRLRELKTRLLRWGFDRNGSSYMVDPPSYHFAAEMVFRRARDEAWLLRLWDGMRRSLDFLLEERDAHGDGLITIFHPWESGTDMSPQFFSAMGLEGSGCRNALRSHLYPTALFAFNLLKGWDAGRLAAADRFACEELTMNCLAIRACRSMSYLAGELGKRAEQERYARRGGAMMDALDELCWDEKEGCYFPRFGIRRPRLARRKTADSLMPLFGGLCRAERAERLIEEHLLDPQEFWTEYPVPFNPPGELVGAGGWVDRRLWAGHCVWINFCWMLAIGLGEYGRSGEARELTRRVVRMVLREGFFEYYDSRTGEGRRIKDFCWPALAVDMMDRFWPQAKER